MSGFRSEELPCRLVRGGESVEERRLAGFLETEDSELHGVQDTSPDSDRPHREPGHQHRRRAEHAVAGNKVEIPRPGRGSPPGGSSRRRTGGPVRAVRLPGRPRGEARRPQLRKRGSRDRSVRRFRRRAGSRPHRPLRRARQLQPCPAATKRWVGARRGRSRQLARRAQPGTTVRPASHQARRGRTKRPASTSARRPQGNPSPSTGATSTPEARRPSSINVR